MGSLVAFLCYHFCCLSPLPLLQQKEKNLKKKQKKTRNNKTGRSVCPHCKQTYLLCKDEHKFSVNSESVPTGVWCVPGFGAGFEIALESSELQKQAENPGKGHIYFLHQWFK